MKKSVSRRNVVFSLISFIGATGLIATGYSTWFFVDGSSAHVQQDVNIGKWIFNMGPGYYDDDFNEINIIANNYNQGKSKVEFAVSEDGILSKAYGDNIDFSKPLTDEKGNIINNFVFPSYYNYKDADGNLITVDVTTIGDGTGRLNWLGDSSFDEITIPDTVTTIADSAFNYNFPGKKINLGKNVKYIGVGSFAGLGNMETISLPEGLTTLSSLAFHGCSSLNHITIPKTVTTMGESIFQSCDSLTDLTFEPGLESIGKKSFFNVTNLESVVIPSSVKTIGNQAFGGCQKLNHIYLESLSIPEGFDKNWIDSYTLDNLQYVYCLSDKPLYDDNGVLLPNYWHYVDGIPTVWTE